VQIWGTLTILPCSGRDWIGRIAIWRNGNGRIGIVRNAIGRNGRNHLSNFTNSNSNICFGEVQWAKWDRAIYDCANWGNLTVLNFVDGMGLGLGEIGEHL